jgi:hypothetical protein
MSRVGEIPISQAQKVQISEKNQFGIINWFDWKFRLINKTETGMCIKVSEQVQDCGKQAFRKCEEN